MTSRTTNTTEGLMNELEKIGYAKLHAWHIASLCTVSLYGKKTVYDDAGDPLTACIERLLNRQVSLYLKEYARIATEKLAQKVTINNVLSVLKRLRLRGKAGYAIVNGKVFGVVC